MYFKQVKTIEELKKVWKALCMKHHPDRGGSTTIMQAINNEYDKLFEDLKNGYNSNRKESEVEFTEMSHEYRDILEKIIFLDGLEVELCGTWLWVGGNTKEHREILKENSFKWASKKSMWYWHSGEWKKKSKGNMSIDSSGISPTRRYTSPNLALSEATLISHIRAISHP